MPARSCEAVGEEALGPKGGEQGLNPCRLEVGHVPGGFGPAQHPCGAEEVERVLARAIEGRCRVEICSASLMEVCYITLQEAGEDEASHVVGLIKSWLVGWTHPDEKTLLMAGRIKASRRLSFADAQIAATAKLAGATLVHKDPELVV